jgi:hypothetical protein
MRQGGGSLVERVLSSSGCQTVSCLVRVTCAVDYIDVDSCSKQEQKCILFIAAALGRVDCVGQCVSMVCEMQLYECFGFGC